MFQVWSVGWQKVYSGAYLKLKMLNFFYDIFNCMSPKVLHIHSKCPPPLPPPPLSAQDRNNIQSIITVFAYQWLLFNVWCLCLADIRSNGLSAQTVGMALVFAQQVTESDAGLYTCIASWCHHNATVTVLVDVISQEIHSCKYLMLCPIIARAAYRLLWSLYSGPFLYSPDTGCHTRYINCLKDLMSYFGSFIICSFLLYSDAYPDLFLLCCRNHPHIDNHTLHILVSPCLFYHQHRWLQLFLLVFQA